MWIEIRSRHNGNLRQFEGIPRLGAWIEILHPMTMPQSLLRTERGLKYTKERTAPLWSAKQTIMPIYTLIAGVDGVDKSSFTGILKSQRHDLGRIIDMNRFESEYGGALAGGRAALRMQEDCLSRRISFTQETTLSGQRTLQIIRRAKELGYTVRLYYIGVSSAEESLSRIANRVRKGGHDIPEADIRRRFAERCESLARVLDDCDEVSFFDNENGFAEVGAYRNGEIIRYGSYCPAWLGELERWMKKD